MQRNVLVCNLLVICVAVCSFLSFVLIRTPVCSCLFVVSVCVSVCMCVKHHEEEDPKVPDKSAKKATPQAPPTAPAAHPQRAGAKIVVYSPGEQSSPLSQGFPPLYCFCTLSLSLSLFTSLCSLHTAVLLHCFALCLLSRSRLPLTLLESFSPAHFTLLSLCFHSFIRRISALGARFRTSNLLVSCACISRNCVYSLTLVLH